eukprot:TRINITY_DN5184_c0_g1_i3.p1 TRINITY_DN5184_c0_g1~~TRINITY_DN5184_c0_g1_i3.p1  ORF type:complete len:420 (+),score=77.52 TRINITY_DN5184_c0_g1_i3:245-1504(+)
MTEEVAHLIQTCAAAQIPVIPRGAGTGLEGGCIAYQGGVVCDTSDLKKIEIDKENMMVRVGAGVKKDELNAFLEPHGYFFGPDPSSNPSLGGMASTSGSGLSTLKYGTTRENIVSLVVVTAQGEILTTRCNVRKAATGYEITQLFIGAEGTLGVIVELVVKIRKIQEIRYAGLVSFPTVFSAASTVVTMMSSPLNSLVRCELLNGEMISATNIIYKTSLAAVPTLFLEFRGDTEAAILKDVADFEALAKANEGYDWTFTQDSQKFDEIWNARRGCYFASMKYRGPEPDLVYISDVCVPLSKLATCISYMENYFLSAGFPCLLCAHISDGNFHAMIPYKLPERARVMELEEKVILGIVEMGGVVSGEHGVGVGKIKLAEAEHGHVHMEVQRKIKRALDPHNIMNPQKVLHLPKDDHKAKL